MAGSNIFTQGDLVISIVGDGAPGDTTTYTDNQGSPITLEDISTTTGAVNGTLVLPQTTTTTNGVTQNAISGEYGSSSEGTLELSSDGQSLTIAGYGINAATYNSAEAGVTGSKGAGGTYGNNALAQTYSVPTGGTNGAPTGVTAVSRVVADISYNGTVDTSTSLLNIDNTNNPRSVATTDGSTFYVSGQGVKGDTTQGVFVASDGANNATPTAINTATDTRTAELYNGTLYVSADSSISKGTGNITSYGTSPTGQTTGTVLPGITGKVALGAGTGNSINGSTGTVDISPENFFFANANTLYIADSGNPKGGTAGDGGLQKWTFANGTWSLNYTLSSGLNLVSNTTADPGSGGAATTGLIGLAGKVNTNGTVSLYATNATIGDLNQTYVYGITDTLAATTAPNNESFSVVETAAPDTNIRGIAFAPSVVCYVTGTLIRTARGQETVDVAVEDLAVGDLVVTASGAHRPIKWLGHRGTDCARHPEPRKVWPVRVAAGALGAGLPSADLWLSPGHALCLDDVLYPVRALVHGDLIQQVEQDTVTYWHVELDSHDILIANGVQAESYLDTGNRSAFDSAAGVVDLHPNFDARSTDGFCRPYAESGPLLAAARFRLFGTGQTAATPTVHLVADGLVLTPARCGNTLTFVVPERTLQLRLASPRRRGDGADIRMLGVLIDAITIETSAGRHDITLDDPRLFAGFHDVERTATTIKRWTDGAGHFANDLWAEADGAFVMRLTGMFDWQADDVSGQIAA